MKRIRPILFVLLLLIGFLSSCGLNREICPAYSQQDDINEQVDEIRDNS